VDADNGGGPPVSVEDVPGAFTQTTLDGAVRLVRASPLPARAGAFEPPRRTIIPLVRAACVRRHAGRTPRSKRVPPLPRLPCSHRAPPMLIGSVAVAVAGNEHIFTFPATRLVLAVRLLRLAGSMGRSAVSRCPMP
jgi:hypothetical protein